MHQPEQQGQLVRCRAGGRGRFKGIQTLQGEGGGGRDENGKGLTAPSRLTGSTNTVYFVFCVTVRKGCV